MKHLPLNELNKYLDNELSREDVLTVEEHLEHCPECAAELKELQSVTAMLKNQSVDVVPDRFDSLVMSRIVKEIKSQKSYKRFLASIFTVFGLSFVGLVWMIVYQATRQVIESNTNSLILKWIQSGVGEAQQLVNALVASKHYHSFEASMMLFFVLTIYFIYEKFRTIRN